MSNKIQRNIINEIIKIKCKLFNEFLIKIKCIFKMNHIKNDKQRDI